MDFGRVLIFFNIFGRSEYAGHTKVTLSTSECDDVAMSGKHDADLMNYAYYVSFRRLL